MIEGTYERISNWEKILALYQAMRDNHGTGRDNGLTTVRLAEKAHLKKASVSSALQTAKKKGWLLRPPLVIDHDTRRVRRGDKMVTIHVHFIHATNEEARDCVEKHHIDLVGRAIAQKQRLDILSEQFPKLVYTPIQMISRRIQLMIPFPVEKEKK